MGNVLILKSLLPLRELPGAGTADRSFPGSGDGGSESSQGQLQRGSYASLTGELNDRVASISEANSSTTISTVEHLRTTTLPLWQ